MNRSSSHLFWLLPLGVVACLLAMIYLPPSVYSLLPLSSLSRGHRSLFIPVIAIVRFLLPCLVVGVPLTLIAVWLRRRGGGAFLPARPPLCDRTTRAAEVLLLAGMGIPLLVVIATVPSNHGMLLHLDRLTPSAAKVHVTVAVGACVCALGSLAIATRGRGVAATLLMAGVLAAYGLALNGPGDLVRTLSGERREQERRRLSRGALPNGAEGESQPFAIDLEGTSVVGAELWVNDVFLGKTPYQTTLGEFHRKVPYWEKPPKDARSRGDLEPRIVLIPWSGRPRNEIWGPAAKIRVPPLSDGSSPAPHTASVDLTYYARFKYAEEWAQSLGGGGGGKEGWRVSVVFPNRLARLNALYDKARLSGYRVDEGWLVAAETFGTESWYGLLQLSAHEPGLGGVLDQWATWKYGLRDTKTADEAWAALQRVRQEAENTHSYVTCSTAGRAVELLLPRLDPAQLATEAAGLIRSCSGVEYSQGKIDNRLCFSTDLSGQDGIVPCGGYYSRGWGRAGGMLPPSAFPIAHAVWLMDGRLDGLDDSKPNAIEELVVPEMIRRCPSNEFVLEIAASFGGPAIETFLLRHDWRAPVGIGTGSNWDDRMSIHGHDVNRWLYLLAHLRGPAGDAFRAAHGQEVMGLAEVMAGSEFDLKVPAFVFYDLQNGPRSLAAQFWPKYKSMVVSQSGSEVDDALACQFGYLVKMDPLSTPEMYVDCWRAFRGESYETMKAIGKLKLLPPDRRRVVLDALIREVRRDISNFSREHDIQPEDGRRRSVLALLQIHDEPETDDKTIQEMIASLSGKDAEKNRRDMSDWLENTCPTHAVIPALARSSDPALRIVCLGALRSHPSPAHRALLELLLKDPDAGVRTAAENVREDLARLASTPLSELASDPTATRPS